MARYEHRVFRVKVMWNGGDYYLGAMVEKNDDYRNIDDFEQGWEFVVFVPNPEINLSKELIAATVRLAVFRRRIGE
jgi:hypothetical protein